ncbi:Hypothetical predicted protein [Pelobates cultripes]|uniref:Uncharacterized protein n=1 Tax=Pelobates cultripes TaxID=61616 RepID=A0AAD1R5N3_PELCU|nr:Hypothetical predicted protein [Pelobates cultripes]
MGDQQKPPRATKNAKPLRTATTTSLSPKWRFWSHLVNGPRRNQAEARQSMEIAHTSPEQMERGKEGLGTVLLHSPGVRHRLINLPLRQAYSTPKKQGLE